MFDDIYQDNKEFSIRRWGLSIVIAVVFYLVLFYTLSVIKGTVTELPQEDTKKVDVEFAEEVVQKEEPKPEAPKVEAAAPVIPPDMKVIEVDQPIPQSVVPTDIPDSAREADPSKDKGVRVSKGYVRGQGDPLGVEGGVAKVERAPAAEPVRLPEDAIPPEPFKDNPTPKYPVEARNKGISGVVHLKIVIDTQGNVIKVDVLKGEEPFISSAVEAVKQWKYKPAYSENKPISVYKIIKLPFSIKA